MLAKMDVYMMKYNKNYAYARSNVTSAGSSTIKTTGDTANIITEGSNLQSGGITAIVATGGVSITEGRVLPKAWILQVNSVIKAW